MKKMLLIIGISAGVIVLLVVLCFMFTVTGAFSIFMPNPPKPEIIYGEFPISVTYELNGETKVIEDTIICEFDGFESHGTAGKYRKWKSRLKSGNEYITLIKGNDGNVTFEIRLSYGSPNYYMGDLRYNSRETYKKMLFNKELNYTQWENDVQTGKILTEDETLEKYKLKIIDVQYSLPIQNGFK